MKKHFAILLFVLLALGLCVPPVFAQASGTVKGVCKDAQGNPVADGIVVWTNVDNGQKYHLKTNKKGEYFSLGLSPGKYNVALYKTADDMKAGKEVFHQNGFQVQLDENTSRLRPQEGAGKRRQGPGSLSRATEANAGAAGQGSQRNQYRQSSQREAECRQDRCRCRRLRYCHRLPHRSHSGRRDPRPALVQAGRLLPPVCA